MREYLVVLLFAAMPALGNFAGGLLAEALRPSRRALNLALHAAVGIVIAVVAVELMPRAVEAEPAWLIALSFFLGAPSTWRWTRPSRLSTSASAARVRRGLRDLLRRLGGPLLRRGARRHGLDGRRGARVAPGPGAGPGRRARGVRLDRRLQERRHAAPPKRLLLSAAFAVPIFLGATIGYWGMRGQPEPYQLMLLTFTAGVLTTLVVEELVPEAHEALPEGEGRLAPLAFVGGFALFALISAYLG